MPVRNLDVGAIFDKVADLLEIEGENQFRVRVYWDVARIIAGHS
jgi:DNA polymerase (family 10)